MLSVEARGVWHTRGSYYSRKLHDMANEQVCILGIFVSSVKVCNLNEIDRGDKYVTWIATEPS